MPCDCMPNCKFLRSPSKTRLLALSNCDNKSAAALIALPLNEVAKDSVHHSQAGVSGRSIATNIVNLEAKATEFMLRRAPRAGVFAFDQAAALPSLSR